MTSMFWIASSACVDILRSSKTERRTVSAVLFSSHQSGLHRIPGAVARGDALLLRVLRRVRLDLLAHQLAIGLHPVGDHFPLRAVPLLELHQARTLMIQAGDLERRHEAGG